MNTKKLALTALMVALVSGGAVFAGPGGNGNGNGKGASRNDNGRNSNGVIASELKWRNAGHASAQAFENANPDSAVGLLATLQDTAGEAYAAAGVEPFAELREQIFILEDIDEVEAEIALMEAVLGFDPDSPSVEYTQLLADLDMLKAELALPETLAEPEIADAVAAVGLDDLSVEAIETLWALLEGK